MKANTLYIIILLIAAAAVVLFATGNKKKKKLDERITLRRQDKIPYGTNVAYRSLSQLFPGAKIIPSRIEPGYWDSIDTEEPNQAFISITDYFNADKFEMKRLIRFAENGNDVFISAKTISYEVRGILMKAEAPAYNSKYYGSSHEFEDSLRVSLEYPRFAAYSYPGFNFGRNFNELNTRTTEIIGKDDDGYPNFIHLRAGKGNLYVHLAPLAFSNYFLLHKNNIRYFESAISVLAPGVKKIIWDEFYLRKKSADKPRQNKKSWFAVFTKYPGLGAALLTAICCLAIYVLLEMRRKQRIIPLVSKPRNDSMDFVKTIGRLYYEKSNHRNLAKKMTAFFLEYVRTNYKLPTGSIDEQFTRNLQYKTGMDETELRALVKTIKYIEDAGVISSSELNGFYNQLESFYKKA